MERRTWNLLKAQQGPPNGRRPAAARPPGSELEIHPRPLARVAVDAQAVVRWLGNREVRLLRVRPMPAQRTLLWSLATAPAAPPRNRGQPSGMPPWRHLVPCSP